MTRCRQATLPELEEILDWAADEGWNPGLEDAAAFYGTDPEGFFVAVDEADVPIAAISVVNHTETFAFLGLYIVRPEHRGQGVGLALWQHALKHAGARTVGLDGVEAQQSNYEASGFVHSSGTTRYSGGIAPLADPEVRLATEEDIPALISLVVAASGVVKTDYLQNWFTNAATRKTLVLCTDGAFAGLTTIRKCRVGAKIGPLIADSASAAERLVVHAATLFEGPLILDVPEAASGLSALCQTWGWNAGFRTARMYRGAFSPVAHPFFAVTSLELG